MGEKEIDKFIKRLGSTWFFGASEEVRANAAAELGKIKDSRATPVLIKALSDRSWSVRSCTAYALGEIKDTSAVPALLEALRDNKNFVPTYIEALGKIGDPRAVPALLEALVYNDSSIRVYRGDNGSEYKWNDRTIRLATTKALGNIDDPRVVPALMKVVRDNDKEVREVACEALNRIGDPSSLYELLKDGDGNIRLGAARALIHIGLGSRAVPALIELFNVRVLKYTDYNIPCWAAGLLGEIGDSRAVPDLIKALEDGDRHKHVRSAAAQALAQIGDPSFVPTLIKALVDDKSYVRKAAACALETMNDIRALKPLEYLMKNDSDEDVRKAAYKACAKIRSSRGILEEEPTHKISAGGDILVDSAKFSNTFSDNSTKISDVGMIKDNVGGKKDVPFSKCPYCGAELNLPKTPKFCPYCGDQLRE